MKGFLYYILMAFCLCSSCISSIPDATETGSFPPLFPDYTAVTIPPNIAPLNFRLENNYKNAMAVFSLAGEESFRVDARKGQFTIPVSKWKKLLLAATGKEFQVTIYEHNENWMKYQPFAIRVSDDTIDPYIAYRLIEPGYELWNRMGLYQRNLETYQQSVIYENKMTENNCVNCHSFCMQDPEQMLFHMREKYPSTMLIKGNKIEKLNTKTDQTISFLVYPSWHPSGDYVAFSVNNTSQAFHANDPNRVEVFDMSSDVVVYDVNKHEIVTTSFLSSPDYFETFPTFSPDGSRLFFCSAEAKDMPHEYEQVKYNLCSVSFDPTTATFGQQVDTLYHIATDSLSAKFPRVSPDGRFLMYTLSSYGNFSIWHKDAGLHMIDLTTNTSVDISALNSEDVESYHSWSSNSSWVVFSSRRIDGLYTRPYIAHINEAGIPSKPFLLPQKDTRYYDRLMKSYNIPEFITGKVKNYSRKIALTAKENPGIPLSFNQK